MSFSAHHKGYMELRLCPHNSITTPVSQSCLDQHILLIEQNGDWTPRYLTPINTPTGWHNLTVKLPSDVICSQCVLQWRYHTGMSMSSVAWHLSLYNKYSH